MHRTALAWAKTLAARILIETKREQGRRAQRESELPDEACQDGARQPNTERAHQSSRLAQGRRDADRRCVAQGRLLGSRAICYA